jgi:integrative and conjugative element protein (TIGR02256 family)
MLTSIKFLGGTGTVLVIPVHVLKALLKYRQTRKDGTPSLCKPESGGYLLGTDLDKSRVIVVEKFTKPRKDDERDNESFVISNAHMRAVSRYYKKSGGLINIIGDWHTHPDEKPISSSTDNESCKEGGLSMTDNFYSIIIGTEEIRAYEFIISRNQIKRMELL